MVLWQLRAILAGMLLLWGGPGLAEEASADLIARGEAAYVATCAGCHDPVSRLLRRIPEGTAEQRAEALDSFLAGHRAPDAAIREAIVAYLVSRG